jgi:hypothetical protein
VAKATGQKCSHPGFEPQVFYQKKREYNFTVHNHKLHFHSLILNPQISGKYSPPYFSYNSNLESNKGSGTSALPNPTPSFNTCPFSIDLPNTPCLRFIAKKTKEAGQCNMAIESQGIKISISSFLLGDALTSNSSTESNW